MRLRKFPYWYLIAVPVLLFTLGAGSNQAVLIANHGKFPVLANDAFIARQCIDPDEVPIKYKGIACTNDGKGGEYLDPVHVIMTPKSRLKLLSDIFDLGDAVYSIGDLAIKFSLFMLSFTPAMWLALTVRKLASFID